MDSLKRITGEDLHRVTPGIEGPGVVDLPITVSNPDARDLHGLNLSHENLIWNSGTQEKDWGVRRWCVVE